MPRPSRPAFDASRVAIYVREVVDTVAKMETAVEVEDLAELRDTVVSSLLLLGRVLAITGEPLTDRISPTDEITDYATRIAERGTRLLKAGCSLSLVVAMGDSLIKAIASLRAAGHLLAPDVW